MRLLKHPIKKLTLLAFLGGGYVLGAKAGRERYEQIRQAANQVKDDPRVQQATSQAEEFVRETATKVKDDPRVKDVVTRAEEIARDAAGTVSSTVTSAAGSVSDAVGRGGDSDPDTSDTPVSPLLADEHVEVVDEVVYSSGPDIEETIDELAAVDDDELKP